MPISEQFYEAVIPEPCRVLGLALRPLSMGHLILLSRFESPFFTGASEPNIGDLSFAVFICSQTYEDALEWLDGRNLATFMMRWNASLRKARWPKLWKKVEIDYPAQLKIFLEYIKDALRCPEINYEDKGNGEVITIPMIQMVRVQLMMKTSLTESEIMNRPWSLSLWDLITIKQIEGHLSVVDSDRRVELQRMADEFGERFKAKGNELRP